jgi:colanic acid/amylovoran biosynthesis glycosyltransferase
MDKVAIIIGNKNYQYWPRYDNWANHMQNHIKVNIYSNDSGHSNSSINNKLKIINLFIKNIIKCPPDVLTQLIYLRNYNIKSKIKLIANCFPLLKNDYKVIHFVIPYLYQRYYDILKYTKKEYITSFRGGDTIIRPYYDNQWNGILQEIFQNCNHLHYISNYLRRKGIELGACPKKTFVIYPGIDIDFFNNTNIERTNNKNLLSLVTTGRLSWEKGYICCLKAIKLLIDSGYKINYKIIGDGERRDEIIFWIRNLGIDQQVKLLGYQSPERIKSFYELSDIYIQPSLYEALGAAAIEASSMELPIIASNVGGLPEVVEHGATGLLVPPNDASAIAQAVMSLANNREKRIRMGQLGREKVIRQFSLEREVKEWLALYEKVLNG